MRRLITAVLPLLLLLSACGRSSQKGAYYEITGYAQGGLYSVKLRMDPGVDLSSPECAKTGIDSILTRIDTTLSGYNPVSQLSRFNAGETIVPNDLFIEMYELAYRWYQRSEGALDFAAGPVFDIWGFGFSTDSLPPSDQELEKALAISGMKRLKADIRSAIAPDGTLRARDLLLDDCRDGALPRLNYNAIAQGWSCDRVAAWLSRHGVSQMMVNIGEIYCQGLSPSGQGWTVGIDSPYEGNFIPGETLEGVWSSEGAACGIVTSGNYRKFYIDSEGRHYAHTLDPRSGRPVRSGLLSATVTAPDAAEADALATWCMVIGKEASEALIASLGGGYSCYLIYDKGDGKMSTFPSPGFKLISR